jgi:predicted ester cyclase
MARCAMASTEDNKRTVIRLFDDVWNGGRTDLIPELYAEDFVGDYRPYAPLREGHAGVRTMVEGAAATFTDYHEELLAMVADGDRVAVHLRISGVQTGTWGQLAPSGRRLEFEEMLLLTFDGDGRVVHQRGIVDNLSALRQAGALPSPR